MLICVTTKQSYESRVTKALGLDPSIGSNRDWTKRNQPDTPRWGRLICDEAHLEVNEVGTVVKFTQLGDSKCKKWCLAGTYVTLPPHIQPNHYC